VAFPFGGKTYVLVEGPTWQQARANAQALGGDLVVINSAEENALFPTSYIHHVSLDVW
jgi:hypothetical protein